MTHSAAWSFRLYIAGDGVQSAQAVAHLQALCDGPLGGRCHIEIVDVLREPERAQADGVVITPTLLRLSPLPVCKVVGTLADSAALLQTLNLPGAGSGGLTAEAQANRQARIAALIETLHATEQQLEELTAGGMDTLADRAGRTFLLRSAEEQMRQQEASKQMALLNALPAHIAVLDADGVIVAVNDAWRLFADQNGLRDADHSLGRNYLDACGPPLGDGAASSECVAAGLHAVLSGERSNFSIEYACDSPTEQRWFMLMATPLATGPLAGAVVMHIDVSARARAEQALRESKTMLDMAGRIAKVGGWSYDLAQRRLTWSDMVARLHDEPAGHSPSMELGLAAFAPEHRDGVRAAIERCIRHGVAYDLEAEKISATGRRIWVRTIGEAVRNTEGRIVRIQGALQDITERKLTALQTQKLAQRLSSTLESISDAFFTVDSDWRFTYINREAERLWERERHTLLGQVLWDIYPEAVGSVFEQLYRRAMGGETGISCEAQYAPMQRWFGIDCHPVDHGLSVYFRDVTESRAARQQLMLLEASVAQLNDIVVITEPAPELPHGLRIVFVNDAFVQLTGYAPAEVIGRSPGLLDGPSTDAAEWLRLCAAVARFAPVHGELVQYTKEGQPHPFELDITPVAATGEGFTHFVSVLRDISERRSNEEVLRELNAGLENRVHLRTLELERARELAEQANRAKSSFLATMSHEIRTPMNGVVGMIEVLEESPLRADQREMVKTVRESAHALLTIVDDVLDFSKIEAGEFVIDHEPMDVAAVVEGVGDALRILSDDQGVGLRLYTDPRLPWRVLGDAGRLRQVLMNLVGNAVKFSGGQAHRGAVSLRAQWVAAEGGQDVLELVVTDNGVGMDADTLARIFSPFTQADASTTRRFGGTGLGLSISHRLVAMMGGSITVSSALEQGSVFTVRLPVTPAAGMAPVERPLTGVPCLVLGAGEQAADLADYLTHAGCAVVGAMGMAEGLIGLQGLAAGGAVVVVAGPPDVAEPVLAACRAVARERPTVRLSLVVVHAGQRVQPRQPRPDQIDLDGDCLHRSTFLRAVVLATSREANVPSDRERGPEAGVTLEAFEACSPVTANFPTLQPHPGTGQLILVAEDNVVNQQVLARQLALLGYRAEMVGDGAQALARWRCGDHALLLTDLHMPGMDGYMLAAAIRAEEGEGARLPIVALTANALRDEAVRCRQAGMDAYLTKPVRLAQLKSVLHTWLRPSETRVVEGAAAEAPVDLSVLAELLGDDPLVMQDVLAAFRSSTLGSAKAMARAHADGAVQAMSDVAHKMKSGARSIGAARLGQICADIEAATAGPHAEQLGPLMASFEHELMAVHRYLDTQRGAHSKHCAPA